MMDDLISRQAANDAINQMMINRPLDSDRWVISDCLNKIVNLPSAQQWIPCSEMLPLDKGVYLVTDDSGGVAWVEKAWFMWCDDGRPFWEYANVTAWMPLPEPYKEGDE